MSLMYRKGNCISAETQKTLSMALIQCHFDYLWYSWHADMSQALKNKLQMPKIRQFALLKSCVQEREISNMNYPYYCIYSLRFLNVEK